MPNSLTSPLAGIRAARVRAPALLATLVVLVLATGCLYPGLEQRRVPLGDGYVNAYVLPGEHGRHAADLVVFLAGSAVSSALGEKGALGWRSVTHASELRRALPARFDLLVPEYRNVEAGTPGELLERGYTLDERVGAAVAAIDATVEGSGYESVTLVGHSEGAMILPRVHAALRSRGRVTKVVLMAYGGLSQYECFRILAKKLQGRRDPYRGQLAHLDEAIEAIGREPTSLTQRWLGWPYRRWASFGPYRPMGDLLAIQAPILIVHGEADDMAPVESSRFAADELRKAGRSNVTYREYPGADHGLHVDGGDVIGDVVRWVSGGTPQSSVDP